MDLRQNGHAEMIQDEMDSRKNVLNIPQYSIL